MMARTTERGGVLTGSSFAANSAPRAQTQPNWLSNLVEHGASRGKAEEILRDRNLDWFARPRLRIGYCSRDCRIGDCFRDINWLRTRLMCSHHGDSPA